MAEKSARLAELNALLNMDEKGSEDALGVDEDATETEVADRPRQPVNYAGRVAERTADNMRKPSVLAQLHAKAGRAQRRTAEIPEAEKSRYGTVNRSSPVSLSGGAFLKKRRAFADINTDQSENGKRICAAVSPPP